MKNGSNVNLDRIIYGVTLSTLLILVAWYYKIVIGFEFAYNDDLLTLTQVQSLSIGQIFKSTIIDSWYYRPVIQLFVKGSLAMFSTSVYPIRLFQIALHLSTLVLFYHICKVQKLNRIAINLGLLSLCFSSFTYFGISKYAIEIGTYLLGFLFVLSVLMIVKEKLDVIPASLITILALLTREQGLLIALTCCLYFSFSKKIVGAITMVLLVCSYLLFKIFVFGQIGGEGFIGSSGWFFDFLTVSQLEERIGDNMLPFFVYNIVSHLISLVFYVPVKGQIVMPDIRLGWFICTQLFTSAIIVYGFCRYIKITNSSNKKNVTIILIVTIINAVIAYSYCRYRMLFIAGIILSFLLSYGADSFLIHFKNKKILYIVPLLLCLLWSGTATIQLQKLTIKSDRIKQHYKVETKALPGVDQKLYNGVRDRLMDR